MTAKVLTPYRFAKLEGKKPQMVYNYIKKGLIKATKNETGHYVLNEAEMAKWHEKWAKEAKEPKEAETADKA